MAAKVTVHTLRKESTPVLIWSLKIFTMLHVPRLDFNEKILTTKMTTIFPILAGNVVTILHVAYYICHPSGTS